MEKNVMRYTKVAIYLHWLIAILMIVMLFFGEDMIRGATGTFYPSLHASLGISILILTLVRVWWRMQHSPPPQPTTMKSWEMRLSGFTHCLFYVLMIGLPLSGLLSFGHQVTREAILTGTTLFGVFGVPLLPDIGSVANNIHGLGGKLGQVLVILHVVAALKHQFWDKDRLLARMSPH
jgi:cytochrome b561